MTQVFGFRLPRFGGERLSPLVKPSGKLDLVTSLYTPKQTRGQSPLNETFLPL